MRDGFPIAAKPIETERKYLKREEKSPQHLDLLGDVLAAESFPQHANQRKENCAWQAQHQSEAKLYS